MRHNVRPSYQALYKSIIFSSFEASCLAFASVLGEKPLKLPPVFINQFLTPSQLVVTALQFDDQGAVPCDGAGTPECKADAEVGRDARFDRLG